MAAVAFQGILTSGVVATYSTASGGGDTVPPGPGRFIHVVNGSGAPTTVTLVTPALVDGTLAVADRAVTVAAGTSQFILCPSTLYADPVTGLCSITWSATTTITFACLGV